MAESLNRCACGRVESKQEGGQGMNELESLIAQARQDRNDAPAGWNVSLDRWIAESLAPHVVLRSELEQVGILRHDDFEQLLTARGRVGESVPLFRIRAAERSSASGTTSGDSGDQS